jgi:hemerythrin
MKISWSKELAVGVAEIDEQHQQWIKRLNDVAAAIAAHVGPAKLGQTLDFLADYTQTHFATEEKLMAAAQYPGLAKQLAEHKELTGTLKEILRDFNEEGATTKLAETVNNYLGNWLLTHIREQDLAFGKFLKSKPA